MCEGEKYGKISATMREKSEKIMTIIERRVYQQDKLMTLQLVF